MRFRNSRLRAKVTASLHSPGARRAVGARATPRERAITRGLRAGRDPRASFLRTRVFGSAIPHTETCIRVPSGRPAAERDHDAFAKLPHHARPPVPPAASQPEIARPLARLTQVTTEPAPVAADEPAHGMKSPTTAPEDLPPVPEISSTPSGLPVRVPQANLADPLGPAEPATASQEPAAEDDLGRSPEEIRRIVGSYQSGTRRGRSEAAKAEGENQGEGEDDR
ncbi:hypothetical protein [Spirillospora sp. CA-294931]|uniref:hypothetical protein n=1 Tax=Spirillospora sp. CA-294931 TaxID=3240042 RepID=UPI003D8F748E